jgi:hypothetical protein
MPAVSRVTAKTAKEAFKRLEKGADKKNFAAKVRKLSLNERSIQRRGSRGVYYVVERQAPAHDQGAEGNDRGAGGSVE